ncbi:MAG: nucleotide-binding universal stress UspA family protein [Mariniblastus sp.]
MKKFKIDTVLVPWDFSEMSEAALKTALEMVASPDKIEVIHVTPFPASAEYGVMWGGFAESSVLETMSNSFHAHAAKCGLPDLKFAALFGDPGSRISSYAEEQGVSLIVISSHGHTGLSRLLLGSVAERVVRMAPCPVLVLRGSSSSSA